MLMESSMRFGRGRGRSGGRGGGRVGIFRPIMPSSETLSYDGNSHFDDAQYCDRAEGSHEGQQPDTSERYLEDTNHFTDRAHEHAGKEIAIADSEPSSESTFSSDDTNPPKKMRKGRGKAIGISKPLSLDHRKVIEFESGRPVGDDRNPFITKIGIWANDQAIFPYQTKSFDLFPESKLAKVVKDANEYFDIRYDGDIGELIESMCRRSWNNKRSKMYRKNYVKYKTHERALRYPPKGIDGNVWQQICAIFKDPKWKEMSERNRTNRSHQDILHIAGRTSFAQKKVILREKHKREPYRYEIIESCFLRPDGSSANPVTTTLTEYLMHKIDDLPKDPISGAPQGEDQIFEEVLGPEWKGRKRGMGRVGNSKEFDNSSFRAKVEELTEQLAERDKRDAERDKRDAERESREIETARHINYLMAQVEALSQRVNPVYGTSLPQMSHQLYGTPVSIQTQVPHRQQILVPHQQNSAPMQQQLHISHEQPLPVSQLRGGFTELLQRGMDKNDQMVTQFTHHEEQRSGVA